MSLIVEKGEERILQLVKDNATWQAQLYTDPTTSPASTDELSDYTLATFNGSAAVTLNSWGLISDNSDRGQMSHAAITWTAADTTALPQTVLGYVVFDSSSNLIWATKFDTPQTINTTGDFVTVNITLQLYDSSLA